MIQGTLWQRMRGRLAQGLRSIFRAQPTLGEDFWQELEELLITSDMGARWAASFVGSLKTHTAWTEETLRAELQLRLIAELKPYEGRLKAPMRTKGSPPWVVLAAGINGSGKTTALGKLAYRWGQEEKRVRLIAADTFRAAATEQLEVWAQRSAASITKAQRQGQDPCSVVFAGMEEALKRNEDIVLIDTAGRLSNAQNLMDELSKVHRTLQKMDEHYTSCEFYTGLLMLDATVGQHALAQAEEFQRAFEFSGIILNKWDSSAKGGILLPLLNQVKRPCFGLGVGEGAEDLISFDAQLFVSSLLGVPRGE